LHESKSSFRKTREYKKIFFLTSYLETENGRQELICFAGGRLSCDRVRWHWGYATAIGDVNGPEKSHTIAQIKEMKLLDLLWNCS